jgi:hypothetical protein
MHLVEYGWSKIIHCEFDWIFLLLEQTAKQPIELSGAIRYTGFLGVINSGHPVNYSQITSYHHGAEEGFQGV